MATSVTGRDIQLQLFVQEHGQPGNDTCQSVAQKDPLFKELREKSEEVSFRSLCSHIPNTTYLTHGIHPYPAKFIPHIPHHFIRTYTQEGDLILDPFCGSGTTLVEAVLLGRHVVGCDINPLSKLLCHIKTAYDDEITKWPEELERFKAYLEQQHNTFLPQVPNIEFWFDPEPMKDLGRIFYSIREFDFSSELLKEFVIICASATVRKVSKADPKISKPFISRHQREFLSKGNIEWRTLFNFHELMSSYYKRILDFRQYVKKVIEMRGIKPSAMFVENDARILTSFQPNTIDGAVTSPPYVNAQEYFRSVKLELFWTQLADIKYLQELNRALVGSERVELPTSQDWYPFGHDLLDGCLKSIYEKDRKRWLITYMYFEDLQKHFKQMLKVLKPHAYYGFLVGDNTIRRVPIPVHLIVIDIAQEVGFDCVSKVYDRIISRSLTPKRHETAGLIDVEWFLLFRKPGVV